MRRLLIVVIGLSLVFGWMGCSDDDGSGGGSSDGRLQISGDVAGVLSAADGPYLVTGDVTVPDGQSLVIEPGVEIYFQDFYKFEVNGVLDAVGTESSFIHFTTDQTPRERGDWKGLWLIEADDGTHLKYVQVSYANRYDLEEDTTRNYDYSPGYAAIDTILHRGAITIRDCSPTVERCIIDNAGYDGIQVVGEMASPLIQYNTIVLNAFNGIRVEPDWIQDPIGTIYGNPVINSNIIVENDDAGIRMPNSNGIPTIHYNNIWNNAALDYIPVAVQYEVVGDVHLNPEFVDLDEGDYSLHPCSGAIDRGNPDDPTDEDETRADVGAIPLYQAPNDLAHTLTGSRLHLTTDYQYYRVTCDVEIAEGDEFIIDPGVEIRFVEDFSIVVHGKITAVGTENQPILFTSANDTTPEPGDWRQIFLDNADSDSRFENVIIEYGSVDDFADPVFKGVLSLRGSSPDLVNVTIRHSYQMGLFCYDGSSPDIDSLHIVDAKLAGLYCELNSNPNVQDALIHDVQGYGVHVVLNSSPHLQNLLIYDVSLTGVVVEQLSNPVISHLTLYGPQNHGFRIAENCNPRIQYSIVSYYGNYGVTLMRSSYPSIDYVNLYTTGSDAEERKINQGLYPISHEVDGDPLFVNPDNRDFHLQSASPCLDVEGIQIGAYGSGGSR